MQTTTNLPKPLDERASNGLSPQNSEICSEITDEFSQCDRSSPPMRAPFSPPNRFDGLKLNSNYGISRDSKFPMPKNLPGSPHLALSLKLCDKNKRKRSNSNVAKMINNFQDYALCKSQFTPQNSSFMNKGPDGFEELKASEEPAEDSLSLCDRIMDQNQQTAFEKKLLKEDHHLSHAPQRHSSSNLLHSLSGVNAGGVCFCEDPYENIYDKKAYEAMIGVVQQTTKFQKKKSTKALFKVESVEVSDSERAASIQTNQLLKLSNLIGTFTFHSTTLTLLTKAKEPIHSIELSYKLMSKLCFLPSQEIELLVAEFVTVVGSEADGSLKMQVDLNGFALQMGQITIQDFRKRQSQMTVKIVKATQSGSDQNCHFIRIQQPHVTFKTTTDLAGEAENAAEATYKKYLSVNDLSLIVNDQMKCRVEVTVDSLDKALSQKGSFTEVSIGHWEEKGSTKKTRKEDVRTVKQMIGGEFGEYIVIQKRPLSFNVSLNEQQLATYECSHPETLCLLQEVSPSQSTTQVAKSILNAFGNSCEVAHSEIRNKWKLIHDYQLSMKGNRLNTAEMIDWFNNAKLDGTSIACRVHVYPDFIDDSPKEGDGNQEVYFEMTLEMTLPKLKVCRFTSGQTSQGGLEDDLDDFMEEEFPTRKCYSQVNFDATSSEIWQAKALKKVLNEQGH